jgi:hypothetical protein
VLEEFFFSPGPFPTLTKTEPSKMGPKIKITRKKILSVPDALLGD